MRVDFTNETTKEIQRQMCEWTEEMFTGAKGGTWDINTVMRYSPVIQMLNNELTGRFVKRTTQIAIGIAVVALLVSGGSLWVSFTALTISKAAQAEVQLGPVTSGDDLSRALRQRAQEAYQN